MVIARGSFDRLPHQATGKGYAVAAEAPPLFGSVLRRRSRTSGGAAYPFVGDGSGGADGASIRTEGARRTPRQRRFQSFRAGSETALSPPIGGLDTASPGQAARPAGRRPDAAAVNGYEAGSRPTTSYHRTAA